MPLKESNLEQIKAIREYVKENGKNPDDENEETRELEYQWIERNSEKFRKKWNSIYVACTWQRVCKQL